MGVSDLCNRSPVPEPNTCKHVSTIISRPFMESRSLQDICQKEKTCSLVLSRLRECGFEQQMKMALWSEIHALHCQEGIGGVARAVMAESGSFFNI